jgi:hypothetical protein
MYEAISKYPVSEFDGIFEAGAVPVVAALTPSAAEGVADRCGGNRGPERLSMSAALSACRVAAASFRVPGLDGFMRNRTAPDGSLSNGNAARSSFVFMMA